MPAVICASCGTAASSAARFCGTCGNPMPRVCLECGTELGSGHRFCSACGTRVEAADGDSDGERRATTVLCAVLADANQGEAGGRLVEAVREAATRHGGDIHEIDEGRVLARFDQPEEQGAVAACFAAIDIPRILSARDAGLTVRTGVHSGEVAVGSGVSPEPTIELAAALQRVGRPGIALITSSTADLARGAVRLAAPFVLDDGIEVVELMGKAERGGAPARRAGGPLTPFVGRANELSRLQALAAALAEGEGSVVVIAGDAGVGKSRLLVEFASTVGTDVEVLGVEAAPYDRSTPYRPITDLVRFWLGRWGGGDHNVREVLEILDSSLTVYADALQALIGAPTSASWRDADAGARRQTTRRAVRATLGASALVRPMVLVFEDVQWMDGESLTVISELVDLSTTAPVLVLATASADVTRQIKAEKMELTGLMGTDVSDLVDLLIGTRSSTASIREELSERTDGTPLFLEEIVRLLADQGVLEGRHGRYKRGEADLRTDLPATVEEVVASRLDRLPANARETLELVAVHGDEVEGRLLAATSPLGELELSEALEILVSADLLFTDTATHGATYVVKHRVIRDAAYWAIAPKLREELHARVAEAVIALELEADWTERLAHHTFEAGQWEAAARFTLASAERAAAKSAFGESERFLSMSLEALALLPKNQANIEQTIDALLSRRSSAGGFGGGSTTGLGSLDDAESLANEIGDLERVARVNLHRSYARSLVGHHRQGILDADRAHGIGQQLGARSLTAEAHLAKAQNLAHAGRPALIGELLARDLTYLADEAGRNGMVGHRIVHALAHLAVAHGLMGRFDAGRQAAADAMGHARRHGVALDEITAQYAAAAVEVHAEQFKRALELAREGAERATAVEFTWMANLLAILTGYSTARMGSFDDGVTVLERAVDSARTMKTPMHLAWGLTYLSELMTACGQNEQARSHAQEALAVARKHKLSTVEVMALQMLGRAQHRLGSSRDFFEESLALGVEHGLEPLTAQVRFELGWTLAEMGESEAGQRLMDESSQARTEMGLTDPE